MKAFLVAGARPNFMKIASIYRESLNYDRVECKIIHTGQHTRYPSPFLMTWKSRSQPFF